NQLPGEAASQTSEPQKIVHTLSLDEETPEEPRNRYPSAAIRDMQVIYEEVKVEKKPEPMQPEVRSISESRPVSEAKPGFEARSFSDTRPVSEAKPVSEARP